MKERTKELDARVAGHRPGHQSLLKPDPILMTRLVLFPDPEKPNTRNRSDKPVDLFSIQLENRVKACQSLDTMASSL
jgi:hypothetical protein